MQNLDERLNRVLECIVESYVETAEPVGSRTVSKMYSGHLSPASIRNVMADLEDLGLIDQPHTSAGRIPTERGYRHYVNSLDGRRELEEIEVPDIHSLLEKFRDLEEAAEQVSRLLADLTGNTGVLYLKGVERISRRVYVEGTVHLVEQPEFRSQERVSALLRALEAKQDLAEMLERDLADGQLHVHIGREAQFGNLSGVSFVVKDYGLSGEPAGCVGVIGPTRMRYDRAMGIVRKLSEAMTEFLSDG